MIVEAEASVGSLLLCFSLSARPGRLRRRPSLVLLSLCLWPFGGRPVPEALPVEKSFDMADPSPTPPSIDSAKKAYPSCVCSCTFFSRIFGRDGVTDLKFFQNFIC